MATTYKLTITSIGRSLGIVLPDEVLSRLKVGEGDFLYITESTDGSYLLTSYDPEAVQDKNRAK